MKNEEKQPKPVVDEIIDYVQTEFNMSELINNQGI